MSDIINARMPAQAAPALPLRALLSDHQVFSLCQQLRADLARDLRLRDRLAKAGAQSDHVRRRIAATEASLLDMEAS